jgi:hypothetical protein
VVVGRFGGSGQFATDINLTSGDVPDIFVVKLDKNGDGIWARAFGADATDVAHDVATDPFGNITVVGDFEGNVNFGAPLPPFPTFGAADGFAVKFDPNGTVLWAQQAGGSGNDGAYGVAVDALGASYVTGIAGPDFFIGGEPAQGAKSDSNIFFAKLEP